MKSKKIKTRGWIMIIGVVAVIMFIFMGCAETEKISQKSGAQLWAENCQRCHNTPPPSAFSHTQWETIGLHMQTRAQLTDKEREKIVKFLQQ